MKAPSHGENLPVPSMLGSRLGRIWLAYAFCSSLLIGTSVYTGRMAHLISGEPHYLFTEFSIAVEREVPPANPTDAALDALFEEAGEPVRMIVDEPRFVLGLLDATGPMLLVGLVVAGIATRRARRPRQPGKSDVLGHRPDRV